MGGLGSGGHNKKPAKFHKLAGSYRADRHGHEVPLGIDQESVPKNPPRWLSANGKRFWREHRDYCITLGTLDALTTLYYEVVCEAYSHVRELDAAIQAEGAAFDTGHFSKPHPLLSSRNSAHRELLRGMTEFGLTPAGRKRLRLEMPDEPDAEEDPFEEFFSRRSVRQLPDPRVSLGDEGQTAS